MATALCLVGLAATAAVDPTLKCKPMKDIYKDGRELCTKMWGDAFKVESNEKLAYNPTNAVHNQEVSKRLSGSGVNLWDYNPTKNLPNECLKSNHHDKPTITHNLGVCGAYGSTFDKTEACCPADKVHAPSTLNDLYGSEYHWDRCGTLSASCQNHFVSEACLYQCEPSAAYFRRYPSSSDSKNHVHHYNASNSKHNEWEIYQMPLSLAYCNQWYSDCKEDSFCGTGNFFSCEKLPVTPAPVIVEIESSDDSLSGGYIALIVIACVVAIVALIAIAYLIFREKTGRVCFTEHNFSLSFLPRHATCKHTACLLHAGVARRRRRACRWLRDAGQD